MDTCHHPAPIVESNQDAQRACARENAPKEHSYAGARTELCEEGVEEHQPPEDRVNTTAGQERKQVSSPWVGRCNVRHGASLMDIRSLAVGGTWGKAMSPWIRPGSCSSPVTGRIEARRPGAGGAVAESAHEQYIVLDATGDCLPDRWHGGLSGKISVGARGLAIEYRMHMVLVFFAVLPSCQPGRSFDTDSDGFCNSAEPYPAPGSDSAFYRGDIDARLQIGDRDASISLGDAAGDVPGVSFVDTQDSRRVAFVPAAPLRPGALYTATLHWCNPDALWSFTTSDVGAPLGVPPSGTYYVSMNGGHWKPSSAYGVIHSFIGTTGFTMVFSSTSEGTRVGLSASDCPQPNTIVEVTDPYFRIDDVEITDLWIRSAIVEGAFAPNTISIDGISIRGEADLSGVLWFDEPVCDWSHFRDVCRECADGSGFHCLAVDASDLSADWVEDPCGQ